MICEEGYVYHIKESYFEKVNYNKLMANKENCKFRSSYFCFKYVKTKI